MAHEQPVLAVIPAAGASSRMGRPKALLDWFGTSLVQAHVIALSPRCRVVVVVGCAGESVRNAVSCACVANLEWRTTSMIDSIRCGVGSWAGRVVVQPVDTPPVERDVLDALLAQDVTSVPLDRDGQPGHPVVLSPDHLEGLRDATSLRALTHDARRVPTRSRFVTLSFNDPDHFTAVCRLWREHRAAAELQG